jgi:hypothetical protein
MLLSQSAPGLRAHRQGERSIRLNTVPLKDVYIALVTGLIGYLSATLQTIGTLRHERHKALNAVLYSLLEIRRDIHASDPKLVKEILRRLISERFGKESAALLETPDMQSVVSQLLDTRLPFLQTEALASRYAEAVKALVPFCPLIALRLAGVQVVGLDQSLRSYYEGMRHHPIFALDPNAPASITKIEHRTVEQGFHEITLKLTQDVRRVAWQLGPITWLKALLMLRRQNRRLSTDEFYSFFTRVIGPAMPPVAGGLTPASAPANSAPTG